MIENDISDLLKDATSQKASGDIDGAVILLKKAYELIAKTNISYPVETFLRLPLYLQTANKYDEAWDEFNNLIDFGFPNQMKDQEVKPFDESIIYDKMRLFLQRSGKNQLAVLFGIFSYLKTSIALHRQKRNEELFYHKQEAEDYIKHLLKKAKRELLIKRYMDIIEDQLKDIDQIDIISLKDKIFAIDNEMA